MKREYNFSSLLIIQIILVIIKLIINRFTGGTNYSDMENYSIAGSIVGIILTTSVSAIASFLIARGLLKNRMGTLGEYFDNFNYLDLKLFGVSFVVDIIPFIGIFSLPAILRTVSSGSSFKALGSIIGMWIVYGIGLLVYQLFTSYKSFVVADNPDLEFGSIFKKIFKIGSKLIGKTFKTLLKWIILPVVAFLIVVLLIGFNSNSLGGGIFILILSIALVIYIFIAIVIVEAELSDNYLDYKDDSLEEDEKLVYQS